MDVVQAPAADRSWFDGSGESMTDQPPDELTAVLAAGGARERAVLPFQKAPGVDHDGHQELTLPLGPAVRAEGADTGDADTVERPVWRVFVFHRNSSIPRGCGPEPPPLPREPTK